MQGKVSLPPWKLSSWASRWEGEPSYVKPSLCPSAPEGRSLAWASPRKYFPMSAGIAALSRGAAGPGTGVGFPGKQGNISTSGGSLVALLLQLRHVLTGVGKHIWTNSKHFGEDSL